MRFGDVLRSARETLNLSQEEMALVTGAERSTYARWELSQRQPEVDQKSAVLTVVCHKLCEELVISRRDTRSILDILSRIIKKYKISLRDTDSKSIVTAKRTKKPPDPEVKRLSKKFGDMHEFYRGYKPPIKYPAWGAVIKRLRAGYTPRAIEGVMKAFFETPGRTKTSIYDFENAFGNVYGYLYDKAEGKR